MCNQSRHHWLRHLLGQCEHYQKVNELQYQIVKTRAMTNKELKNFNKTLNLIIKDDNIKITLTNIRKVSQS